MAGGYSIFLKCFASKKEIPRGQEIPAIVRPAKRYKSCNNVIPAEAGIQWF